MTECAVDNCYKKQKKGCQLCKEHEAEYQSGKKLVAFYGKEIQKKGREGTK